jgi:thiosulfate/3-mercaptopyruvate sulfurtransferase
MTSTTMTTEVEPLVETPWLAAHAQDKNVCVIEVDVSRAAYDDGHLPGAQLWNVYADLMQPNYRVIEREPFAALLARSGIAPETTVVLYGYAASLGFWLLRYHGHRRATFLNGSRRKWLAEQLPLSLEPASVLPSSYSVEDFGPVRDDIRASHAEVFDAIGDPGVRLMDVRSAAEYTGERFWPSLPPEGDQRGGHVPGAILVPIEDTWREDGSFKPLDELRAFYSARGFSPEADADIITYCAVGGRASQAWFVLSYLLGYPRVRVYDASWIEWGLLPGAPVER